MLRIAVCDDMMNIGMLVCSHISNWAVSRGIGIDLKYFESGEELIADMEDYGSYQIFVLDICLGGMDGIEVAQYVRGINTDASIIFMSASSDYYRKALQVYAVTFLDKPIATEAFQEIMSYAYIRQKQSLECLEFFYHKIYHQIRLEDILYFTSSRRKIIIVKQDGSRQEFYDKLDELEKRLKNSTIRFLRIHKSYYINMQHILSLHGKKVIMQNALEIPISVDRRQNVKELHRQYLCNL